ncbi:alkanesulfonate monooxygenase SsuD/methylene tetrahydromethanopterin reductase-like flavin-dependent oxidoreductase (luciferase family) [Leucobacter exalbidus]|uniref:Alkanesulfonate monooxygenase SsuD/methylene tetrahydromethanopterin reductase-like flavin-dependent oxidoreductase (Luciferase family) n=1 Tax=Leucobacter exalbidus TaxID=662960 RepID=A0A940PZN9_9MICO|nr:LLM class flavin-dependent oxidoreductase [Leucobacter exalbidus]MBP1327056.1 alkanesulfonate monooxygenase SsuD/methylene tetrahydromethanopterin reductase-like flavin-dependent oxidoreductase (luciferase family) [Leucobacter exalbidus]
MSSITQSNNDVVTVGLALDGAGWHPAAWREAQAQPERLFTASYWQELIVAADAAGLDYVTLEDSLRVPGPTADIATSPARPAPGTVSGRLDAVMVASWVAPHTHQIGILPTVTTTHTEPFHVATGLQTLDHISEGRAGWQLRVSLGAAEADAFGRKQAPEVDVTTLIAGRPDAGFGELVDEAADVVEVTRRLWDSWEDDAIIRDAATGRFLDRDRVHHINFEGDKFSVVGPSIVPRSPQGQLPVTLLAHNPQVTELAARSADVVFITPENASAQAGASRGLSVADLVQGVRDAEQRVGRDPHAPLKIVADLVVVLDTDTETATDRLDRLNHTAGFAFESDARILAGSADDVADLIAEWRAHGIDGVRLRPAVLPDDLTAITSRLVPVLRERGLLAATTPTTSLRDRFGLTPAANRYATARLETTEVAR